MKSFVVDGMELFYEQRGDGPPVLLVHGFPLDHSMWSSLFACSTAAPGCERTTKTAEGGCPTLRHRLIAPDLRGFGHSHPVGDKTTMELFADDLAAMLDAMRIDEPVVLCGLSMGGYIALQFWRKYPEYLRGLVLCDTRAAADTPEAAAVRAVIAERLLAEGMTPLELMLPKLVAESTRIGNPRLMEELRGLILSADPRGAAAALRGMAERPDMTDALSEIECPTLLIVGREDALTPPAEMRAMADAIPNSTYVEIPDAGHLAPLENPPPVAAALAEFLS